ncbi:RNA recognition motif domain-containing protein [Penicillium angulare]|uniref:RNA recognition motif domain-containing protein n=1 Tax=Penicillium angulare TaxID=116970 RepID=A0A9W9G7Z6_9EURO|nr:RNA recognition motif domain-containing protein [Penicillium angulare]
MDIGPQIQPDALIEGRRIYIGNLPYSAKPQIIENILVHNGFEKIEHIHISIDPVSARNPGYCFVDFSDKETADGALASLIAGISGRPIKVGPCEPKKKRHPQETRGGEFAFDRWGDWKSTSQNNEAERERVYRRGVEQGPQGDLDHFDDLVGSPKAQLRLYVGGLDRMINQAEHNREVSALFKGFNPTAIGKRITPYQTVPTENRHYCFVDFATPEEADAARMALHGKPYLQGRLKLRHASYTPPKLEERSTRNGSKSSDPPAPDREYMRPSQYRYEKRSEPKKSEPSRAELSNNWRR